MKSYEASYSDSDGYISAVYIRSDKLYDSYSRKVSDILTVLGDIGGLQGFFIGIGLILVGFVTQKMLMSSIVKKIYHMRNYANIDNETERRNKMAANDDENNSQRSKIHPCPINSNNTLTTSLENTQNQLEIVKMKEHKLADDFKDKQKMEGADIYSLFYAFLNRARFKYTLWNIA